MRQHDCSAVFFLSDKSQQYSMRLQCSWSCNKSEFLIILESKNASIATSYFQHSFLFGKTHVESTKSCGTNFVLLGPYEFQTIIECVKKSALHSALLTFILGIMQAWQEVDKHKTLLTLTKIMLVIYMTIKSSGPSYFLMK